jgi:hypothetical protein
MITRNTSSAKSAGSTSKCLWTFQKDVPSNAKPFINNVGNSSLSLSLSTVAIFRSTDANTSKSRSIKRFVKRSTGTRRCVRMCMRKRCLKRRSVHIAMGRRGLWCHLVRSRQALVLATKKRHPAATKNTLTLPATTSHTMLMNRRVAKLTTTAHTTLTRKFRNIVISSTAANISTEARTATCTRTL